MTSERATEGALRLGMQANPHTPSGAGRERHRANSDVDTNTHMYREAHRKLQTYKYIPAQT